VENIGGAPMMTDILGGTIKTAGIKIEQHRRGFARSCISCGLRAVSPR
jgi:hypothetical protein